MDWEALARANGWVEVERDPDESGPQEPCLHHEELDRVWPLGDWEGAARDLGLDEGDFADLGRGVPPR